MHCFNRSTQTHCVDALTGKEACTSTTTTYYLIHSHSSIFPSWIVHSPGHIILSKHGWVDSSKWQIYCITIQLRTLIMDQTVSNLWILVVVDNESITVGDDVAW
jgi:hypothetical protein